MPSAVVLRDSSGMRVYVVNVCMFIPPLPCPLLPYNFLILSCSVCFISYGDMNSAWVCAFMGLLVLVWVGGDRGGSRWGAGVRRTLKVPREPSRVA
jgi:hypothetical protein